MPLIFDLKSTKEFPETRFYYPILFVTEKKNELPQKKVLQLGLMIDELTIHSPIY